MSVVDDARPVPDPQAAPSDLVRHVEGELARVYGQSFAPVLCLALAEFAVEATLAYQARVAD